MLIIYSILDTVINFWPIPHYPPAQAECWILDSKPKLLPSSYLSTYTAQYEDNDHLFLVLSARNLSAGLDQWYLKWQRKKNRYMSLMKIEIKKRGRDLCILTFDSVVAPSKKQNKKEQRMNNNPSLSLREWFTVLKSATSAVSLVKSQMVMTETHWG